MLKIADESPSDEAVGNLTPFKIVPGLAAIQSDSDGVGGGVPSAAPALRAPIVPKLNLSAKAISPKRSSGGRRPAIARAAVGPRDSAIISSRELDGQPVQKAGAANAER
jgi:hypothetical protein